MSFTSVGKIIVTSQQYAENSAILRPFLSKVLVVPPGVHLGKESKMTHKKRHEYILFVGQVEKTHRHKGLGYLIQAMSLLKDRCPDLKLKVIGTGNDLSTHRELAKKYEVESKVEFLGFVPDTKMGQYYAGALCLCLPSTSKSEGFGMVIIEAAAHKTASIGSDIGGISQILEDGKTGLLVEPMSVRDLVTKIEKLYMDPGLATAMGLAAYKKVHLKFSWEKQIDKTKEIFEQLI
jgi:glycosyltransferase involved in cell wall biosynthesis